MSYELIIGDPHLKVSNLENVNKFLNWICSLVESEDINRIVILGDVFHTHAVVRSEVMSVFTSFLCRVTEKTSVILLVGNHDMVSHSQTSVHALEPFKNYKNVTVVDCPTVINNDLFLPFMNSDSAWQMAFDEFATNCSHVYCHQMFVGANMGFARSSDGVKVPDHAKLIINGHIHKAQFISCGAFSPGVWCPGSPYAQEANDVDEDKGVYLFDKSTSTTIFKHSPLPAWRTYRATVSDYESVIRKMNMIDRNHLVLSGPSVELTAVLGSETFKKLKKEFKFSLKKESTSGTKMITNKVSSKTISDAVTTYIDHVYSGSIDKQTLKAKCLEVLAHD